MKVSISFLRQDFGFLNLVGLTIADIDLKNGVIDVNHQLQRKRNMEYVIEETKTECGTRLVP